MVKDYGRTVETIERWVGKGLQEGWCKPVPSFDRTDRFRRRFKADLAMDCEDPPTVEVWGRYDRTGRQVKAIFVDVRTRCRKCQNCLDRKSRFWTGRAMDEFAASPATWLFTITLRPEVHYMMDARMQSPLYRGSTMVRDAVGPLSGLTPVTTFRLRSREIGYEITDMLKRIRKKGPFRYLLVAERHMEDPSSPVYGRPHFHMLLHEVHGKPLHVDSDWQAHAGPCEANCRHASGGLLVHPKPGMVHDHAFVRTQWPHGFTQVVRCMSAKGAVYVCKYVSKDPMARVRASLGYGKLHDEKKAAA